MNRNVAEGISWERWHLRAFFGVGKHDISLFKQRKDFSPDLLSRLNIRQLHETARHKGRYVHIEGGVPALKSIVLAGMIGIPHRMMAEAYDFLKAIDNDAWRALEMVGRKLPRQSVTSVSVNAGMQSSGFHKRVNRGLDIISDYIEHQLRFPEKESKDEIAV